VVDAGGAEVMVHSLTLDATQAEAFRALQEASGEAVPHLF